MSSTTRTLVTILLALLVAWWWTLDRRAVGAAGPSRWRPLADGGRGSLEGRLLLDEGQSVGDVTLNLAYEPVAGDSSFRHELVVSANGRFGADPLPACRARLEVGVHLGETPVLVVDDLLVPPGGPCSDPRLDPLDLRGRVHRFAFRVLDHTGAPVPRATLGWRPAAADGDGPPYSRWKVFEGEQAVVCEADAVDVLVLTPGGRTEELLGVVGDQAIHLHEGWPVRIALPPGVDPGEGTLELGVRVRRGALDPRIDRESSPGGRVHRDPLLAAFVDGEAEVVVPRLGPYLLEWRVARRGGGWRSLDRRRHPIEVGPHTYRERLAPPFPQEAYRAALAAAH